MTDLMITIGGVRYRREDALERKLLTKDGKPTEVAKAAQKAYDAAQNGRPSTGRQSQGRSRGNGRTVASKTQEPDAAAVAAAELAAAEAQAKAEADAQADAQAKVEAVAAASKKTPSAKS